MQKQLAVLPGVLTTCTDVHVFADRGYINFYSLYIGWLCGAVFLHLPSFKALGFDVRTDVSMLLTIFLLSCLVRPRMDRSQYLLARLSRQNHRQSPSKEPKAIVIELSRLRPFSCSKLRKRWC